MVVVVLLSGGGGGCHAAFVRKVGGQFQHFKFK